MALPSDERLAELGKVILCASLLEWDLMTLAVTLRPINDNEALELLKNRRKLVSTVRHLLKEFSKELGLPSFLLHEKFFKRINSAFSARDQVAHGVYLFDNEGQGLLYHPRSKATLELNVQHLRSLAETLDLLSAETDPMIRVIKDRQRTLLPLKSDAES